MIEISGEKYVSLTDMTVTFEGGSNLIEKWLRNKNTIEFLGVWELLNNQNFNSTEFEGIKNEAGTNRFVLSVKKWVDKTKGIGLKAKTGRHQSGTFAHEDIAIEFGSWLSPEFKLYLIKEFKRLKILEAIRSSHDWHLNRVLSKLNYRIHTDAIDQYLVPSNTSNKLKWPWFTSEAELLNIAIFGITSTAWSKTNPHADGNIRDHATTEQLLVMANLENLNAEYIRQGLNKTARLNRLRKISIDQLKLLINNQNIVSLTGKSKVQS